MRAREHDLQHESWEYAGYIKNRVSIVAGSVATFKYGRGKTTPIQCGGVVVQSRKTTSALATGHFS